MLNFSLPDLYLLIAKFFWPALRVLALFITAPVFKEKSLGKKTKISIAMMVSIVIGQNLPDNQIAIFSYVGLWVGIQQFIIGILMGLTLAIIFAAVRNAGEIIGLQMGLSFAAFFDPASGGSVPVIGRILNVLAMLLFLQFNGHLWLLKVLADSFILLPISTHPLKQDGFLAVTHTGGMIFKSGLMLGLPIITLLLALNLTLGLLNRLTPQLSIFVVGFPLTLSIGMVAISMMMYTLSPFFENMMSEGFYLLSNIINLLA